MAIKAYLQQHARKLDLRIFEHLFEGAPVQAVLDELKTFQNADGGFGKALEPDLRLPASSVLATTLALQYLAKLDHDAKELVSRAIAYLVEAYNQSQQRWVNIPPEADKYPRAPWWDYQGARTGPEWGNPSAEVLGYLLQYASSVKDEKFLEKVTQQALQRLDAVTEPEQHEVKCYIRLYELADTQLQARLHDRIAAHIKQLAKTDEKEWEGYVATPLTFIESPDSPFADVFDASTLRKNTEYLHKQMITGDHWEPTWEWGQFEVEWAQAKQDWSGKLTVDNLIVLKNFGLLD